MDVHVKDDCGMRRCRLKGALGDAMHALLCAAGYNLRWLMRWIIAFVAVTVASMSALLASATCKSTLEPVGS